MEIFKLAAIAVIGTILAAKLRAWRPELSIAVALAAGLVILFSAAGAIEDIFSKFERIISNCGIETEYLLLIIKLCGIAYITKFACDICKDSGAGAIASKLEFAGKVTVLALTMPLISSFLELVEKVLGLL